MLLFTFRAMKVDLITGVILLTFPFIAFRSMGAEPPLPVLNAVPYIVPVAPPATSKDQAKACLEALAEGRLGDLEELGRAMANAGDPEGWYYLGLALESPVAPRQSRAQAMDYYYRNAEGGNEEVPWRRLLINVCSESKSTREVALKELEAGSDEGNPNATRVLGEAWVRGFIDGKPNGEMARKLWSKSAESGDASSSLLLGRLYEGRFGVPEIADPKEAIRHYETAAGQGAVQAFLPLGKLLVENSQSPENAKKGHEWLEKAIQSNIAAAYLELGNLEFRQNPDAATALFQKGADLGHSGCMVKIYELKKDSDEGAAMEWLKKAKTLGDTMAAMKLGEQYLKKDDPRAAYECYLLGAKNGNAKAQYAIALMFLNGDLGSKDPVSAIPWLTEAMKSGDAEIQYILATLHEKGSGTPINYANAGVLYTLAVRKGHPGAAARVAFMAAEGLGMPRNPAQAWAHATLAYQRGDKTCAALLQKLDQELDEAGKIEAAKALDALEKSPLKGNSSKDK